MRAYTKTPMNCKYANIQCSKVKNALQLWKYFIYCDSDTITLHHTALHHTLDIVSDSERDGNTGESDEDERRGNAEDDALASKHRRAQFASRQARAGSALRRERGAASHGGA